MYEPIEKQKSHFRILKFWKKILLNNFELLIYEAFLEYNCVKLSI